MICPHQEGRVDCQYPELANCFDCKVYFDFAEKMKDKYDGWKQVWLNLRFRNMKKGRVRRIFKRIHNNKIEPDYYGERRR